MVPTGGWLGESEGGGGEMGAPAIVMADVMKDE